MVLSIRSSILLGVLALALLAGSAASGVLPVGPQPARAADETGEETTTTPTEEPPPVVETPTEPETTPEPETPVTTPPVTTPPVTVPSGGEGGGSPVETPKTTPSTGTATGGGGGAVGGGGGGGGGSSSGSSGSSSGGGTTTSPTTTTTTTTRHTSRPSSRPTGERQGGGRETGTGGADHNSQIGAGGGGRETGGGAGSGGHRAPSPSSGGPAPQPTVSPQAIDRGASAVSNAASNVGDAFAKALPTAPLEKIGDKLTAHIAAADTAKGRNGRRQAADGIGAALGAALIGSAVAVDRTPVAQDSPIPFITPPGGESGTIYLVLIAALLLAVGALVFREARSALGRDRPRTGIRVADEERRIGLRERIGLTLAGVDEATQRWFGRFRRLRANAAAGLRSLF